MSYFSFMLGVLLHGGVSQKALYMVLDVLGFICVVYLVVLGIINWKNNNTDRWQQLVEKVTPQRLMKWLSEKLHLHRSITKHA
jgi:hypothetical protein